MHLVSFDNFPFVALQGTSRDEDCRSSGFLVWNPAITLALKKAQIICLLLLLSELLVDQIIARVDDLECLESEVAMRVPQKMQIWRLLEEDKQLVLVNGPDFPEAAIEWLSFHYWLDYGSQRNSVVVLVHHHGSSLLDVLAAHSSSLERNPFSDLRDLNHLNLVAVSQNLEGAKL